MAYEMKPGSGSAFPVDSKKEDWHADYKGKIMLPDGKVHYLDISMKQTQAGQEYVFVKLGKETLAPGVAPTPQPKPLPRPDQKAAVFQDLDSDIPF